MVATTLGPGLADFWTGDVITRREWGILARPCTAFPAGSKLVALCAARAGVAPLQWFTLLVGWSRQLFLLRWSSRPALAPRERLQGPDLCQDQRKAKPKSQTTRLLLPHA